MAFVRDAIHFCYCCHSELSTFFFLSLDATQDQRGLGANPDFHRLLCVCHHHPATFLSLPISCRLTLGFACICQHEIFIDD